MADLKNLYQQIILDHCRKPRNRNKLQHSNKQAEGMNPLCGDKFKVYLQIENGIICDIGFDGSGCAISIASASMMTEIMKAKTEVEAKTIHDKFVHLLTGEAEVSLDTESLAALAVFSSVRQFPVRIRCATLPWQTLRSALEQNPIPATTE
jgi:nitrogen fixation protein NifU and related proteins